MTPQHPRESVEESKDLEDLESLAEWAAEARQEEQRKEGRGAPKAAAAAWLGTEAPPSGLSCAPVGPLQLQSSPTNGSALV